MQCKHINFSHFRNLVKEIHLIWNSHPSLRTNTYVVSVIFGLHLHKNVIYEYIQAPGISSIFRAHLDQGHQELSGESDENNPLKPNQSVPSIYIMIEICYFSLDQ